MGRIPGCDQFRLLRAGCATHSVPNNTSNREVERVERLPWRNLLCWPWRSACPGGLLVGVRSLRPWGEGFPACSAQRRQSAEREAPPHLGLVENSMWSKAHMAWCGFLLWSVCLGCFQLRLWLQGVHLSKLTPWKPWSGNLGGFWVEIWARVLRRPSP